MKLRPLARLISVLAPLAAGCTDEPPPEPVLVTIKTGEPPALLAFRDQASSTWQAVATAGVSTFEVNVRGRYEVLIVCENVAPWPSVIVRQHARTPADQPLIRQQCNSISDPDDGDGPVPDPEPFVVRGTMVQPGLLALGTSSDFGGSFELPTAAGSFDLIMFSEGPSGSYEQLAIRRGIAVAGDTDLGSIDLAQEGVQPLVRTPLSATNLEPGETLGSMVMFQTSSSGIGLGQSGPGMLLAPQGILQATDQQWAEISGYQSSSGEINRARIRTVTREVHTGEPATVTLPESFGPVTFKMTADLLVATWSALPEHDRLWLGSSTSEDDFELHHSLVLSPAFIEATGATSATLDLRDVPGFKSAWRHYLAHAWHRELSAGRYTSMTDSAASSVIESVEPMSAARASRARATARAAIRDAMLHER
jgi:hypothetical protein